MGRARIYREVAAALYEGLSQDVFSIMLTQRGVLNLAHALAASAR